MAEPARQVIDRDAVHQQVSGVAVAQGARADMLPRRDRAKFLAHFTAVFTQRQAVVTCASMSLPWLMSP